MADIYQAEINPSKKEVLATVLGLEPNEIETLATYRFDDPEGEVGIEVFIVQIPDGTTIQVPLTYRGERMDGEEDGDLITTMEHSVLGPRYVYFGAADPVFAQALVTTIAESGTGAKQYRVQADSSEKEQITDGLAEVRGTGAAEFADDELGEDVYEVVEMFAELDLDGLDTEEAAEPGLLIGTWDGQDTPVLLAHTGLVFDDEEDEDDAEELDEQ